jgi:hypothetical protein
MADDGKVSDSQPAQNTAPAATQFRGDRRRPGRRANVSPELLPLLRGRPELDFRRNDADPIRGIATSLVLSAMIYAGGFGMVSVLLKAVHR